MVHSLALGLSHIFSAGWVSGRNGRNHLHSDDAGGLWTGNDYIVGDAGTDTFFGGASVTRGFSDKHIFSAQCFAIRGPSVSLSAGGYHASPRGCDPPDQPDCSLAAPCRCSAMKHPHAS